MQQKWTERLVNIISDGRKNQSFLSHPLFKAEEMKITLLKGYLLSHTRQNKIV